VRIAIAILAFIVACGSRRPAPPPPKPITVALASPGPLTSVHAALACTDCHVDNTKALDNHKCIGCHAHGALGARIQMRRGLHASALVAGKPCELCHLDHRGASYESLGWPGLGGRDRFDHAQTGWLLAGAHAAVACDRCHARVTAQGRVTYIGTDRQCATCHPKQPHDFTTRRELFACERCHTEVAWQPPKARLAFNHDDRHDARTPLLGPHAAVACAKCHPRARFNLKLADPVACDNCHTSPHAGTIKATRPCLQCHSPTLASLTSTTFDHTERTRFDLGRSHEKLPCTTCHTPALGAKAPSAACETCHPKRSPHKDRFKTIACAACHRTSAPYNPDPLASPRWVLGTFDHAKLAHWPLRYKHADLPCRRCHRGQAPWDFEKLTPGADCRGCHEHATVHRDDEHPTGRFTSKQCLGCHTTTGAQITD
jgi:hypothetical protein